MRWQLFGKLLGDAEGRGLVAAGDGAQDADSQGPCFQHARLEHARSAEARGGSKAQRAAFAELRASHALAEIAQ